MEVKVKRIARKQLYTIGKLYVNDEYICDTIEDTDRSLTNKMTSAQVLKKKVKDKTAIPTGTYQLTLKIQSPKYSKKAYFKKYCNAMMPRILNIPGFEGVLIHTGNTQLDSAGCLIVGYNKVVGKVVDSVKAFEKLYPILKTASDKNETIKITIS